ncbi:MAG: peptidoglycan DD-metalloendopeptidase family protein [Flavobacteriaceae bacterium]|nr:peptidoglycan DD-metalloendopeptidase family protein [Flavobacteriaceae bacterium]
MRFFLSLLFILSTLSIQSQNLPNLIIIDSLESVISKIDTTQIQNNITSKNWKTTVYNPYKDVDVAYPIKLKFEDSTYASPMHKDKVITSRFGWRRGRAHKGIDIDLITGDSLFTMFDGIVRLVKYLPGHGKTVIVRHYNGLETVYAHLSRYGVKVNDTVAKGAYLGKGGATGNARGSHLHLEVNYQGESIHPEYLFSFNEDNKINAQEIWITSKWTRPIAHNSRRKSKIKPLTSEDEALASQIKKRSIYIVKPGDSLSRISARNNVSIASLCKTNSISRNSVIKIGQKLVIEN